MSGCQALGSYLADIWRSRFFWLSLVKMDLQLRYRRSMLGVGWSLLLPLATSLVLWLAFQEIFHQSSSKYVLQLMVGLAWWEYVSGVTIQGCQCFVNAESYIRQHSIPMAVYPLRNALGCMIHFVIALTVVVGIVWKFQGFGNLRCLAILPLSLSLLLLFGWAVSVLVGYVNAAFRDIQHLSTIAFQLLFYLMPIIYPPDSPPNACLRFLFKFNPLVRLLNIVRSPVIDGHNPSSWDFLVASLATSIITAVALLFLQRLQKRIILYL